jgi:4-hydroxybenzoate polyprenyltransferase
MKSLRSFFETIKVEHTLFALPFAYATLFLVAGGWPRAHDFIWITVAMVAARTVGMALNRIIDARIDANNPRTAAAPSPPADCPAPRPGGLRHSPLPSMSTRSSS